jgi:sugar/nucleoside kinase (ribokinase family)
MSKDNIVDLLIAGELTEDYIIDLAGKARNRVAGGSALYACAGARFWNDRIGIISRVGKNYPQEWIRQFQQKEIDTKGILSLPQDYDQRRHFFWQENDKFINDNPMLGYARHGLTFPHELLGYGPIKVEIIDQMWKNTSQRLNPTFPQEYLDVKAAHIAPITFPAQIKLLSLLQKGSLNTITLSPSDDAMTPEVFPQLPGILSGLYAFLTTEKQLTALNKNKVRDLWGMAMDLAAMGTTIIVIHRGDKGYWLYDRNSQKKYSLPFYPTRWVDPTGIKEIFAGSFLAKFKRDYDPIDAFLYSAAVASIAVEGTGPFYLLDSFPGLIEARVEVLKNMLSAV